MWEKDTLLYHRFISFVLNQKWASYLIKHACTSFSENFNLASYLPVYIYSPMLCKPLL